MTLQEFLKESKDMTGYAFVSTSGSFRVYDWPAAMEALLVDKDPVLEIRIFNDQEERKLFRPDLQSDYMVRRIRDSENRYPYFDDCQYLDVDTGKGQSEKTMEVWTTGGGRFHLPLTDVEDARIRVRYYLDRYPETGQARIRDWRIAGFVGGKKDGKK